MTEFRAPKGVPDYLQRFRWLVGEDANALRFTLLTELGPNALAEIFPQLPGDFPVPIVIVQHMPPMFTKLLAERLSAQSPVKVHEGISGTVLQPGHAYVAPGDYHMQVVRDGVQVRLFLHQDPPENSCRPAVDPLFQSVAGVWQSAVMAVVLTGMGSDGMRGGKDIVAAGGSVIAQDEASSVVWGMPGAAAQAGICAAILPLNQIGPKLVQLFSGARP